MQEGEFFRRDATVLNPLESPISPGRPTDIYLQPSLTDPLPLRLVCTEATRRENPVRGGRSKDGREQKHRLESDDSGGRPTGGHPVSSGRVRQASSRSLLKHVDDAGGRVVCRAIASIMWPRASQASSERLWQVDAVEQ